MVPTITILDNKILIVAIISMLMAQLIKFVITAVSSKKLNLKILTSTGGMPSSHSALVMGLVVAIGFEKGLASVELAIAVVFAMIVMYDAAGIRRAAGKQAKILNKMIDQLDSGQDIREEQLKELLGHTPIEVVVGALLGVFIAVLFYL